MTRTGFALKEHARLTHVDARAVESHAARLMRWPHWPENIQDIRAEDINYWIKTGGLTLSASTIGTRLSVLKKAMQRAGVAWPVDVKMPQRSKRPKWVLPPEQQAALCNWLTGHNSKSPMSALMLDYILLVTETGLRVEEVLRIHANHIIGVEGGATLEVMGTKNTSSYDLIPLSTAAYNILVRRGVETPVGELLFQCPYETLRDAWTECLEFLQVTDETATLKALRRTFATRLAARGIPTTLLQKLMRHASLVTTSHYTNTIGLHEAARGWLA